MTAIRHIVFDVGHVLLHWDPELIYLDLIPDAAERRAFMTEVCDSAWNLEQDRGRDWTEAENALIAVHPNKETLIRAYRKHWNISVPYAFDEVASIMTGLIATGHDVTILSNFHQDTFEDSAIRFPFLTAPRGATVSGRVRMVKPNSDIYYHHTKQHDLSPEHTLFIDDMPANVAAARECGWHAIQFAGREGPALLKKELSRFGISESE